MMSIFTFPVVFSSSFVGNDMHIIKIRIGINTPIKTNKPGDGKAKPRMQIIIPTIIPINTANVPGPIPPYILDCFFASSSETQVIKEIKQDIMNII